MPLPDDSTDWYRLDRTAFDVRSLTDQDDDSLYWADKTPQERLIALEYMRRRASGDAATARIQKVVERIDLADR